MMLGHHAAPATHASLCRCSTTLAARWPSSVRGKSSATQIGRHFRINFRRSVLCPGAANLAHLLGWTRFRGDRGSDRPLSGARVVLAIVVYGGVARLVVPRV